VVPLGVGEHFVVDFPGPQFQAQAASRKHIKKVRSTGSLLDKKPDKKKRRALTEEKLDEIGARLENTPKISVRRLAQETGISKSSATRATRR
jgi:transposase